MKTKEMTEVRASVGFPNLTPPNSKYIPKQCLFRHEFIMLRGRWSEESIRRYCVAQAQRQGYDHDGTAPRIQGIVRGRVMRWQILRQGTTFGVYV